MMSDSTDIQQAMEQAADALAGLPVEDWAEWVVYLLETLEDRTDDERYLDLLEVLRLTITTRLEEDLW
jgi:hypothetical protein